jgi:hypothetical protein
MITIESQPQHRSPYWIPRSWLLFFAVASLPFFMRTHIDLQQSSLQAVQALYRDWRWSPQARSLATGSEIVFKRVDDKNTAEDLFLRQIQKDFRLAEVGVFPQVRAYFQEKDDLLRARIELRSPGQTGAVTVWEGESRYTGNGILWGPWIATSVLILGKSVATAAGAGIAIMLLWDTHWNPLDLPAKVWTFLSRFTSEVRTRALRGDWIASEMGRVPIIGLLVWFLPALFFLLKFFPRTGTQGFFAFAATSLLMEPVALATGQLFGKWDMGASWWKILVGSYAYRFVIFSFLASFYLRPALWTENSQKERTRVSFWVLLLPVAFLVAGGWEWVSSALAPGVGETLYRFRIFLVGFLLAFSLGARMFTLWLGILVWAVYAPPTTGHWNASAAYGLLTDGLFLGWWFSPFKSCGDILPFGSKAAVTLSLMAWVVGILLSTVGVPLGICWLALGVGVWGYNQVLTESPREELLEA